jgi:HEPN domain-containing protein
MSGKQQKPQAKQKIIEALTWLAWAEGDLLTARRLVADPEIPPRAAAQHAEQAAEKAVKAELILRGIAFGKQHDIGVLADKLGWTLGVTQADLEKLSAYNSEARYPDSGGEAPNDQDAKHAVAIASGVVAAVRRRFDALNVATDKLRPQ